MGGMKNLCQVGAECCAGSQSGGGGEEHQLNSKAVPPFWVVGLWAGYSSALTLGSPPKKVSKIVYVKGTVP